VKISAAILLLGFTTFLKADEFADKFAIVMIDDQSETKLGPFPYDRALLAKAAEVCADDGAKAVVFKFFFDQAKTQTGDAALGKAMRALPVILQARLGGDDSTTQEVPPRFQIGPGVLSTAVRDDEGWIPLPALLESAAALGFIDFDSPKIPLIEEYRGASYKSLIVCCLELAVGTQARVKDGIRIEIGNGYLPVNAKNVYRADLASLEPLKIMSFERLLAGGVPRSEIEGRVVIIGFDSSQIPTLETDHGRMGIHRFFVQCLAASYRALRANQ
jgi:CHASE2 domain-containing sensor protein